MNRDLNSYYDKLSKKSPKTLVVVKMAIGNFDRYCKSKGKTLDQVIEELSRAERTDMYDFLQAWVNAQDLAPRSIRNYFVQVKKFLRYVGVNIISDDVKEEIDFPEVPKEELHPLDTETELKPILKQASFKYRAFFLGQASAGYRIGEAVKFRKKHLVLDKKRIIIKIPTSIAKFGKARTCILSKEAGLLWIPIIKKLDDDDLIFGGTEGTVRDALNRYTEKLGLDKRYESNNRRQIHPHGFRAWFITRLSRKDKDLSYLLSGQEGYMIQYDRLSDDEKLELYLKYEDSLLVYDDVKKDQKILELEKINEEYVKVLKIKDDAIRQRDLLLDRIIQDKTRAS